MATKKETFIRGLEKEYLLFKTERLKRLEKFHSDILSVLADDCYFVEPKYMQAFKIKVISKGIGSPVHYNYKNLDSIELDSNLCQQLSNMKIADASLNDDWVCVVPVDWRLSGGFLCKISSLFMNYSKLSSFMDDDFDIYNFNVSSVLSFRGDRASDDLAFCVITTRGDYFSFFMDYLRSARLEERGNV